MHRSLALFLISLLLFGCGQDRVQEQPKREEIIVSAASSLTDLFEEIELEFERANRNVDVRLNFGASNLLERQIEEGAPVDVFASAASWIMDSLQKRALILPETRADLARNRLVVIVPDNAINVPSRLEDLAEHRYDHIAIASPGVPARVYTEAALRKAGLWERLEERFAYGANVRQVLGYVENGDVKAGIVYASDRVGNSSVRSAIAIDPGLHPPILYPIAVVRSSKQQNLAKRFIDYVTGPAGRKIVTAKGFSPPGEAVASESNEP